MRKIDFKNFKGFFYVEDYEDHEEENRCKIYDERMVYLDYIAVFDYGDGWSVDLEDDKEDYENTIKNLQNSETIVHFLESLDEVDDLGFDVSKDIYGTLESFYDGEIVMEDEDLYCKLIVDELRWDFENLDEEELMNKYSMNKIGEYYIKVGE